MKTYLAKTGEIEREYILFDASEAPLGRMAVKIVNALRGKDKPTFTPHIDTGNFVIVINASKAVFTGNKDTRKTYQDFSGRPGGQKEYTADVIREKHPERLVKDAVWGMMPKGRLGRSMFRKLRVYPGSDYEQVAQKPTKVSLQE
jgi:large subunit ribosomal protein L13